MRAAGCGGGPPAGDLALAEGTHYHWTRRWLCDSRMTLANNHKSPSDQLYQRPVIGGVALWLRLFTGCVLSMISVGSNKNEEAFEVLQPPPQPATLPHHWQIPDFSLTERSGRTVSLGDLRGKVWVADFFYTTCPGPCPMMTSRLKEIHDQTRGLVDVRLVSISTDPAKDTLDVLGRYAERFGADEKWLFLTGDKAEIYELANKGFKLSVTDEGGTATEPITHSTKLALVDKNGTARGFYDGTTEEESKRLVTDIERLRQESR
jgi:protein SCO1/2